jgi:hypothetical protein
MATKQKGRPAAITKLSDVSSVGKHNWLIYSDSGAGKTVLAGTAERAIFLTVEAAGTESAKLFGSDADEWVVDTVTKLEEAYEYFKNGDGCKEYDWVLIDSLSEIEDLFWADVQGDSTVQKIQDYGTVATRMKREVERWNRLPINVLYTALAQRLDTEDIEAEEDTTLLIPQMGTRNGVLSQRIAAKVTLVGYLSVRERTNDAGEAEEYRRLQLKKSDRVTAKDRHFISKNGAMRDPSIPKMVAKIGAYAPVNAPASDQQPEPTGKGKTKKENG